MGPVLIHQENLDIDRDHQCDKSTEEAEVAGPDHLHVEIKGIDQVNPLLHRLFIGEMAQNRHCGTKETGAIDYCHVKAIDHMKVGLHLHITWTPDVTEAGLNCRHEILSELAPCSRTLSKEGQVPLIEGLARISEIHLDNLAQLLQDIPEEGQTRLSLNS